MKLVFIGYISGPFGINGEVKIISETNHKEDIFKIGNNLYIDNQKYIISSVKKNNKYEIISFDNINSIEKTDSILKKEVYVNVMELKIDDYLIGELLNMDVYEKNIFIGKVTEVLYNKKYTYIRCNKLIIPLIDNYLKEINLEKNIIYVKNIGELNEN